MQVVKTIEEMSNILAAADKEAMKAFNTLKLTEGDWPPEGYKGLSPEDLKTKVVSVDKDTQKWFFPEGVPVEAYDVETTRVGESEQDVKLIPMNYAVKHGYPIVRINTQLLTGDVNTIMAEPEDKVCNAIKQVFNSLETELGRDSAVIKIGKKHYVSDVRPHVKLEAYTLLLGFSCLVAAEATDDYLKDVCLRDFQGRIMLLQKSMTDTLDTKTPLLGKDSKPMELHWEFSADDAQIAFECLLATNTEGAVNSLQKPEDLMKISFRGLKVKSVTAERTMIKAGV